VRDLTVEFVEGASTASHAHLVRNEFFKGEWCSELDFAMLADEWPAHRARSPSDPAGLRDPCGW
jgi:hypothetical protein